MSGPGSHLLGMRALAVLLVIGALLAASGVAVALGASGSPKKMTGTVLSNGLHDIANFLAAATATNPHIARVYGS